MLKIIHPGVYSTIQDLGRYGYRSYGVPLSGAMDQYSSQFANLILGNDKNDAVLEMTMTGITAEFLAPTIIAVTGGLSPLLINDEPASYHHPLKICEGDRISFKKDRPKGCRAYLALKGGFDSEVKLESRSMFTPVTNAFKIDKGDILGYKPWSNEKININSKLKYNEELFQGDNLAVFPGPEFHLLNDTQRHMLQHKVFKVSSLNDRMAYQIKPRLKNCLQSILSAPVMPGTVQLTPDGNLVILMRDAQTTGGYPRIFQLTEESINKLAQKTVNHKVRFEIVFST